MTIYLTNPPGKGKRMARKKAKAKTKRRRKGPSRKQLANQRRFARMAKARAKARKSPKKRAASGRVGVMAKRKRATTKRRRRSPKRRSVVRHVRRSSAYRANPRRARRRRGGYRRNPGMLREVFALVKSSGAVLGGGVIGRVVTDMLPDLAPAGQVESPVVRAAKGTLVAFGVHMLAKRFLGADLAGYMAAGAMQVPLKTLIVGFASPESQAKVAGFLGEYSLGAYSVPVATLSDGTEVHQMAAGMSSYSEVYS